MTTYRDKRILITGASSGIGAELARQFAAQGAKLALAARRADRLESVAEACRAAGGEAVPIVADVTEPAQCQAMVEQAIGAWGGLDVLVVNAGFSMWARFDEITDITLADRMIRVNVLGAIYATYYALSHLKESRGQIIVVSSLTGKAGVPTRTLYSASKHALHGFFDSLRIELMNDGVGVTIVCPGFVSTELQYYAADGTPMPESPRANATDSMPVEECVRIIIRAAAQRKREEVMTATGKIAAYLRPFFPALIDGIALRKIEAGRSQ